MKFYSNRKPIEVTSDYEIDGTPLEVKQKWLSPCSLTLANATVILLLNKPYNGKNTLFLERDWTTRASDNEDDFELVAAHNKEIQSHFEGLELLTVGVEAAIGASMSSVYISENFWICPESKWCLDMKKVHAVFFERMSSYTRTFDIVFCGNDNVIDTLTSISRKQDYKRVMDILSPKCTVYSTGPDPLDWRELIKFKKKQHSWKEVAEYANSQEDSEESEEEWVQGETDEEFTDESSEEYQTDTSEEESTDEDIVQILDHDYDNYERQSKIARHL